MNSIQFAQNCSSLFFSLYNIVCCIRCYFFCCCAFNFNLMWPLCLNCSLFCSILMTWLICYYFYFAKWQLKEILNLCVYIWWENYSMHSFNIFLFFLSFWNRRNVSGSSTPSGMRTPRKQSVEQPTVSSERKGSRGTTPSGTREPFRL